MLAMSVGMVQLKQGAVVGVGVAKSTIKHSANIFHCNVGISGKKRSLLKRILSKQEDK